MNGSHRIEPTGLDRIKNALPFGLGRTKPKHFRDMATILWRNRDNLPYAWKVLSRGVCDGCALGVAGFHDWTIDSVHLCMTRLNLLRLNTMPALDHRLLENVKDLSAMENAQLRELGRLPYPMLREKDAPGFRRISWEEAWEFLVSRVKVIEPRRMAFYVTARGVTNEVYYLAQKSARALGTNHVDNAARICHSPSTAAMKRTLGVSATTCSYKDWYGTDLVIFFGSNPANDQPVTTKYLHEAKKLGTRIVMVNPYREPAMERYWVPSAAGSALFGTSLMDYWFPVAQGGDIAFLTGVVRILLESDWVDNAFLRDHVTGLEDLRSKVGETDWGTLENQSGLDRQAMREFAELLRDAKTGVLVWSMGITQHRFGGDAVQMILNLGLLKGWLGRDQCGLMPIRGHSSVQGGAEMGAYATAFPGPVPITPESARELSEQYQFPVPDWTGYTTTEMVEAGHRDQLDLLYCLGGNFLRTLPEPDHVREALANVPVRVHQDIILTDQMFIPAKEAVLLLPARTRYEQEDGGTETITERRVIFSPEIPRQVGEAESEWKILRELAVRVRPELAECFGCRNGREIREEIARVIPLYDGVQQLQKTGDAFQYGGPHLCPNGQCPTPDGKARLHPVELPRREFKPGTYAVSTRRGKQFNTLVYAEVDPINDAPRDAVLIHPEDAAHHHLMHGDSVLLKNDLGSYRARVHLAPMARGNLQVYWPEANHIIRRGVIDRDGGVPDYNATVELEKIES